MPFTPQTFKARHNKKLGPSAAAKGARVANAMIKKGLPEGEAIATGNARADNRPRKGRTRSPGK